MKFLNYTATCLLSALTILQAECDIPDQISPLVQKASLTDLKKNSDIRRNFKALKNLCVHKIVFKEGKYNWRMLLVTHPKHSKGAFWFLPHDDENTAFDAAVYATQKYGGGFLAVMANGKRYFSGQDPNRNFGETIRTAETCKQQKYPAPKYSKIIFSIINAFRAKGIPYLALHNNKDGWFGNGGHGSVSILRSSKSVQSYPATSNIGTKDGGLKDEDSLVYIAGYDKKPNKNKLNQLLELGLNTKYEIIHKAQNDCSLSNYVVLKKGTSHYYNIEAEHQDLSTQKKMIDKVMKFVR